MCYWDGSWEIGKSTGSSDMKYRCQIVMADYGGRIKKYLEVSMLE